MALESGTLRSLRPQREQLARWVRRLERYMGRMEPPGPGDPERWLWDNQYLIQMAAQNAREGLRRAKKLPALAADGDTCRLTALAGQILSSPEPPAQDDLTAFLRGVQTRTPLLERELRALLPALQWAALETISDALRADRAQREAAFRRVCSALQGWSRLDFQAVAEQASQIHAAFLADPTGDYARMPSGDRAKYRRRMERLALKSGSDEAEAARALVERAGEGHIGFLLFAGDSLPLRAIRACCAPALLLASLLLALCLGFRTGQGWLFVLFWLPAAQIWKSAFDAVLVRFLPRRPVFRLSLPSGFTPEERTLAVLTAVIGRKDDLELVNQLERIFLANQDCGRELSLGILADYPERDAPMSQADRDGLRHLIAALDRLNRRYGGCFFLFFRPPVYQPAQGAFAGWERKRGALLELARLLRGRRSGIEVYSGDRTRLNGVKYLAVLDSDTDPGVGGLRPLVGAMRHPLNRPRMDEQRRVVTGGYGILQPRMLTRLAGARANPFTRLFSGGTGGDPYRGEQGELCHDLFDAAPFCGKGVLDIDCLLFCLDGRLPQQKVLSHDILEGAFLHAGTLSQVSFWEGFPQSVSAYYRRQHRWVRGDWQNYPWIGPKSPTEEGGEANPISAPSRWKLADNLRRSLTPVVQMLCLLLDGATGGALGWLGWTALASVAAEPVLAALLSLGPRPRRRFHARVLGGGSGVLAVVLTRLALLPLEGWTDLSAICTALWRSLVSRKHLLQWTTSAQQGTRDRPLWPVCLPMLAAGLFLALTARQPAALLLALLWLASPVVVTCLEHRPPKARLRTEERAFLLHEAELIWGFFADFLKAERNFLPPDNYQLRPYQGPAERTSPTNIGFAALSCLAAVDLELERRDSVLARLEGMLDTLERMEKWKGNLYNWYHTVTLRPLKPKVVSSVDSGNLCACLFALSAGLEELGRADLARRAQALARKTDLGALYDSDKHLFYVSYQPDGDQWSQAHYDLMASEARLLSYAALALGQVEGRHWSALSRAQARSHGYQGMVSWFGTMFEYFMPHLLLPLPEDSLLYESLAFCVCEQHSYGRLRGIPWGISESAVPTLDQNGCYGYRANGVPTAALSRLPERAPVLAPYAAYLALSLLPHRAVENLRRLRADGLEGKYGLYEAAEYSQKGITPARSWMSHHMGMSLAAIDNALGENILVRRLMSVPEFAACRSLLEEAVPRGDKPLRRHLRPIPRQKAQEKPPWQLQGEGYDPEHPVCVLLRSGALSALVSNAGACWLRCEGVDLTDRRHPPALFLRREQQMVQLFPCEAGADVRWTLGERRCAFTRTLDGAEATLELELSAQGGLAWTAELTGTRNRESDTVYFLLRPQLASERDFWAHPAFCLLRIETEHNARRVTFRRRDEGGDAYPVLGCGWTAPAIQSATGPRASKRLAELGLPQGEPVLLLELSGTGAVGNLPQLSVRLDAGETVLRPETADYLPPALLKLSARLLPELVFSPRIGQSGSPAPQSSLWALGISGDDPIVIAPPPGRREEWNLLLQLWRHLCAGGVPFDLVIVAEEAQSVRLRAWAEENGISWGGHRGVHLLPASTETEALLRGMACADLEHLPGISLRAPTDGAPRVWALSRPGSIRWHWEADRFVLSCHGGLPPVRWSIPLSNGAFGYLALDTGGGYLWARNARMFRITPWDNDPWAQEGPEDLVLTLEGQSVSLFARRDGLDCTVTFGPGWLRWEKDLGAGRRSVLTAFVPPDQNERVFLLELEQMTPDARLAWRLRPQMGEYPTQNLWAAAKNRENRIWLTNPVSGLGGIVLSFSGVWEEIRLPEGRRHDLCLSAPAAGRLVLQAGEPCADLTPDEAQALLEETQRRWRSRCGVLEVETPDPALNHYLSFWGQYQVQASRMLARTSVYQCGGAYGFRDQLQDCCALLLSAPDLVREHILRCCRHQFQEGDVLHWWHEDPRGGADAGVRTRMTDDLLWLPYTLSVWWEETGQTDLLLEQAPYLAGARLGPEERDRYFAPETGKERESVYRHGIRAIECVLGRGVGEHGLCRMGGGDWNDGMDRVGAAGRGESVWLTWFAALVLRRFAPVCEAMGEQERAGRYRATADALAEAGARSWDGAWFLRGYFDSGAPLGGRNCPECQIDSISQSFAALVLGDCPQTRMAMERAHALLMDEDSGTVALLTPPFDGKGSNPGYIADYRPGRRENGGQYTHAAVWMALAWFRLGESERGWSVLRTLLPEHHPIERYRAEPFVLAADVSRAPGEEGAAGWSWYTGAAGWYWRVAVQELLGIRFRGRRLYLEPNLPAGWDGYRATLRLEGLTLQIHVQIAEREQLLLDGTPARQGLLLDDLNGAHILQVEFLRKRGCAPGGNHV